MGQHIYIITGIAGHLGGTLARMLTARGERVRGLALKPMDTITLAGLPVDLYYGDVRHPRSLEPLFKRESGDKLILIHAAGIVAITSRVGREVYDVNVGGTQNILGLCGKYKVDRMIYVSSVHAIPEPPTDTIIKEVSVFSPKLVVGGYAKTKATATQLVLRSVKFGLNASIVHPSGIMGPGDYGSAHLTQMVVDFLDGRLRATVKGGYDFVDVRDVAEGILDCVEQGSPGECYILSDRYYTVAELMQLLHEVSGRTPVKWTLPLWLARSTAPLAEQYYHLCHQPPLYTPYSLHTLTSFANFSHEKATKAWGYDPRPLRETLADTCTWLSQQNRLRKSLS